jgi:hypothetical protein
LGGPVLAATGHSRAAQAVVAKRGIDAGGMTRGEASDLITERIAAKKARRAA